MCHDILDPRSLTLATMTSWTPPTTWLRHHKPKRRYRVTLHVPGADFTYRDLGGVYLERVAPDTVIAVSGGEDAFESLSYAINDVLAGAQVLREEIV